MLERIRRPALAVLLILSAVPAARAGGWKPRYPGPAYYLAPGSCYGYFPTQWRPFCFDHGTPVTVVPDGGAERIAPEPIPAPRPVESPYHPTSLRR